MRTLLYLLLLIPALGWAQTGVQPDGPTMVAEMFTPFEDNPPVYFALDEVVKIKLLEARENGTGLLVGSDEAALYIMTAAHVVEAAEEFDDETISVTLYRNYPTGEQESLAPIVAELISLNTSLDAAILKLPRSEATGQVPEGAEYQEPVTAVGRLGQQACLLAQPAEIVGFAGGGLLRYDKTQAVIDALHYYNDRTALRVVSEGTEGGFSGSPVFSPQKFDQRPGREPVPVWIGMAVQTNAEGSTKVVSLEPLLDELTKHNIPTNLLRVGGIQAVKWQFSLYDNYPLLEAFDGGMAYITFENDGTLGGGVVSGTYCLNGETLTINVDDPKEAIYAIVRVGNNGLPKSVLVNHAYKVHYTGMQLILDDGKHRTWLSAYPR